METKIYGSYRTNDIIFSHTLNKDPLEVNTLHTHEMCELYCVMKGSGRYIIEGSEHKLEKGKIILMRPGEFHRAQVDALEEYESFVIHFSPSILDSFDAERILLKPFFDRPLGKNNVYSRAVAGDTVIYELFRKIDSCSENNCLNGVKIKALLFSALIELNELFMSSSFVDGSVMDKNTKRIVDYVNSHLTEPLSVEKICNKFFISRTQLNRNFKESTGSPVWEYITAKRLMMARGYISKGMGSVEAAVNSGFGDYSAFYRAYVKKYGIKPSEKISISKDYILEGEIL